MAEYTVFCGTSGIWESGPEDFRGNKMNRVSVKGADLPQLLRLYERATAAHGTATEKGDYRTANREDETIAAVFRELRGRGIEAQKALLGFLDHGDPYVRVLTAAYALEFAPEQGEPVLTEISRSRGIPALNAEMTLQEWRKGNLKFP